MSGDITLDDDGVTLAGRVDALDGLRTGDLAADSIRLGVTSLVTIPSGGSKPYDIGRIPDWMVDDDLVFKSLEKLPVPNLDLLTEIRLLRRTILLLHDRLRKLEG